MTIHMACLGVPGGYRRLTGMATSRDDANVSLVTYGLSWIFQTDGTVDETAIQGADTFGIEILKPTSLNASTWVRCTEVSGLTLTTGTPATWQLLTTQRIFSIERSAASAAYSVTFELATDSGGSNIVASRTVSGEVGRVL